MCERERAARCGLYLPFSCPVTDFATDPANAIRSCAAMAVFFRAIFDESGRTVFDSSVSAPDAAFCTASHFALYQRIRADEAKRNKLRLFLSPMDDLGLFRLEASELGARAPVSSTPSATAAGAGGGLGVSATTTATDAGGGAISAAALLPSVHLVHASG